MAQFTTMLRLKEGASVGIQYLQQISRLPKVDRNSVRVEAITGSIAFESSLDATHRDMAHLMVALSNLDTAPNGDSCWDQMGIVQANSHNNTSFLMVRPDAVR